MEIFQKDLKDILFLKKDNFFECYIKDVPVIIICRHRSLDIAGVILCAPKNTIWKFNVNEEIFGDPLHEIGDEIIEESLLKEFGISVQSGRALFGISGVADSFNYSEFDMEVASVIIKIEVKSSQVDAAVMYLMAWWNAFRDNALINVKFGDVIKEFMKAKIRREKELISIFLKDAWNVTLKNRDVESLLDQGRNKIIPLLTSETLELNKWIERVGCYSGVVNRELFFNEYQSLQYKPNRKLEPLAGVHIDVEHQNMSLRDDFFSIQCAMVRSLKLPSMYWNACNAYARYEESIRDHPVSGPVTFNWNSELNGYIDGMKKTYPIFLYERTL